MIGKIKRVPLRDVWRHEALEFTKWPQDNMDVLNEVVGLSLSNAERERSAGDFNVDRRKAEGQVLYLAVAR